MKLEWLELVYNNSSINWNDTHTWWKISRSRTICLGNPAPEEEPWGKTTGDTLDQVYTDYTQTEVLHTCWERDARYGMTKMDIYLTYTILETSPLKIGL